MKRRWSDRAPKEQAASSSAAAVVTLRDVPVGLFRLFVSYHEELERECALVVMRGSGLGEEADVARAITDSAHLFHLDDARGGPEAEVDAAAARGKPTTDVVVSVDATNALDLARLALALDAADRLCREGHMLTVAPSPEVSGFRRWYLRQIDQQLRGLAPQPWRVQETR